MRSLVSTPFFGAIIGILIVGCIGNISDSDTELIIQSQEDGEVYKKVPVERGDEMVLAWVHSVEKTPWSEHYKVSKDRYLILEETRFQSFGAGVPHQKGDMMVKDGEVIVTDINEEHESLRWIHSRNAEFTLQLNGDVIFDAEELPHHEKIELRIEMR